MGKYPITAAVLVVAMGLARASRADASTENVAAQQVVHLLGYVGSDYGGAVSGGQVVNQTELAEQLDVLAEAGRLAERLKTPVGKGTPPRTSATPRAAFAPGEAVARVRGLVAAHRPEAEVAAAVKAARDEIVAVFDLTQAPNELPSRDRGKQLYEQHCAGCHGVDGRADTPRAAEYTPRPANFLSQEVASGMSPARAAATMRFGVPNTAMVPFDFLSDAERWDVAFYAASLSHVAPPGERPPAREARIFDLSELAVESDQKLGDDLRAAGLAEGDIAPALDDLRARAPYEIETLHPEGAALLVPRARAALKRVRQKLLRGDGEGAKTALLGVYLDDVEPLEAPLRAADPALARSVEARFQELRGDIEQRAPQADLDAKLDGLIAQMARVGRVLEGNGEKPSFSTTMLSSAGIALREGVEAALLIAALLAVVGRAGAPERKRWVHFGWATALVCGAGTWFGSRYLVAMSGLGREMVEGITALLASAVLFYVSYWLFAKREAARWVRYLREKAGDHRAALSLFGISFLAVYREAFETVIFYQALMAQPGSGPAAGAGALLGAALLVGLVIGYGRAGKFAPPQSFFAFSSVLLYALSVVFAGHGIYALQTTGHVPRHALRLPHWSAIGLYPTVETYAVQIALVALAAVAGFMVWGQRSPPPPSGPRRDGITGSREGAKL